MGVRAARRSSVEAHGRTSNPVSRVPGVMTIRQFGWGWQAVAADRVNDDHSHRHDLKRLPVNFQAAGAAFIPHILAAFLRSDKGFRRRRRKESLSAASLSRGALTPSTSEPAPEATEPRNDP